MIGINDIRVKGIETTHRSVDVTISRDELLESILGLAKIYYGVKYFHYIKDGKLIVEEDGYHGSFAYEEVVGDATESDYAYVEFRKIIREIASVKR